MFDQILAQLKADISKNDVEQKKIVAKPELNAVNRLSINSLSKATMPSVLQLNTTPAPIDISQYKNPFGPSNPTGDYISLFKFSCLNNDIPSFTKFYTPSGCRLDSIYQSVVGGAAIVPSATFTSAAFASARANLLQAKFAGLDGTGNSWYPVYANPVNWFDLVTQEQNLSVTEIDLTQPQASFSSQYSIIDATTSNNLTWNQLPNCGRSTSIALNSNSKVSTIRLKFMQVQLNRSWLNLELFSMGGWSLPGQQPGFVSNGSIANNSGVLPLYTTSFIIGTDLEIVANLDPTDSSLVSKTLTEDGIVNLGPFAINAYRPSQTSSDTLTNTGYFIMAWISQVVDFSAQSV